MFIVYVHIVYMVMVQRLYLFERGI